MSVPTSIGIYSFSQALELLKQGNRVAREGWNAKGMWLCRIPAGNAMWKGHPMQDCIGLKNAQNQMQPGWVPSQGDLFADDWVLVI